MTRARDSLAKFNALTRWERRKRREETLLAACCAALGAAVLILPLNSLLPYPWLRWGGPVILLAGFGPVFFYRRRWTEREEILALTALDRDLKLEERALTAWDLARRGDGSPAAQLVFQQTERKLAAIEPQTLFPRRRKWPHVFAPALLVIWLALLWLDVDQREDRPPSPATLAQKARDYAREFQERAKSEGLRESLKMGQELEKAARQEIEKKNGDESFKEQLSALAKKFDDSAKAHSANDFAAAESGQALKDLQAEIAALRDLPELPALPKGAAEAGRRWSERLASMPQLKRRLNDAEQSGQSSGQGSFQAFLDQLEKRVSGELDRRALIDAQEYLKQMMKQGSGQQGENFTHRSPAPTEDQTTADGQREKNTSTLPGKEPGEKDGAAPSLPEFRAGISTQVKGALGEGESTGLSFKAKPAPGKSAVPSAEVVTSYRRQAEQELDSERIPAALKDTIKNYFLSLGNTEKRLE